MVPHTGTEKKAECAYTTVDLPCIKSVRLFKFRWLNGIISSTILTVQKRDRHKKVESNSWSLQ